MRFIDCVKKTVANVGQFAGIMFSLVGANILTKMYEQTTNPITDEKDLDTNTDDICNHVYGCDEGLCWRACNEKSEFSKTICFTKTISEEFKEKCSSANDCSPCGECISDCKETF